jgi:plasmid maintenance system antidote protein VapI
MKTNNRALTFEEQAILQYVMYKKQLNQTIIAKANNYSNSTEISQICSGERNVTQHFKEVFNNCGIDLEEIMNFKRYTTPRKGRPLTPEESAKLRQLMKSRKLSQYKIARKAYTSQDIIGSVCNGERKVSEVMKVHFLKSGIDLNEIMEEK